MRDNYTVCVGYIDNKGDAKYVDIEITCSSVEEERIQLINKLLNMKDIKEVTSIDIYEEDEEEYEDDTLEYAFKDNFQR